MYLVLRCKCNRETKDRGLFLLTLIILVFFDNLFSRLPAFKKAHPEESGRGFVQA